MARWDWREALLFWVFFAKSTAVVLVPAALITGLVIWLGWLGFAITVVGLVVFVTVVAGRENED